jgi:hypothetical protein
MEFNNPSRGNDAPALTKLEKLALDRFGTLSKAEGNLIRAAALGEVARCGFDNSKDQHDNPGESSEWPDSRSVRGTLIRWLCTTPAASKLVDPSGIYIFAALIGSDSTSGTALDLSNIYVPFFLKLESCRITGAIALSGARTRTIDLSGSWTGAITGDGMTVEAGLFLRDDFRAHGGVSLTSAEIRGDLSCSSGTFLSGSVLAAHDSRLPAFLRYSTPDPNNDEALSLDAVRISGNLNLRRGFSAEGVVRIRGGHIGGSVDFSSGSFTGGRTAALDAPGIDVGGAILLGGSFTGAVNLRGARIGADLFCSSGSFTNPARRALNLNGAKVEGGAYLRRSFRAEGQVQFLRAHIGGDVVCTGASFASGSRLSLAHATIKGALFWRNIKKIVKDQTTPRRATPPQPAAGEKLELSLVNTSVGSLYDDKDSWQMLSKLELDGFRYLRFGAEDRDIDVDDRLEWLRRALEPKFLSQPYQHLVKLLRDLGDEAGARKALIEMETRRAAAHRNGAWRRALSRIWYWTTRYGYEPWQAWKPSVAVVVLGWLFFSAGSRSTIPCRLPWVPCTSVSALAPTEEKAYAQFTAARKTGTLPDNYPRFSPLMYSLDTFLPGINLSDKDKWAPDPAGAWPARMLRVWRSVEIVAGYLLAGFALAGFTGLSARKE